MSPIVTVNAANGRRLARVRPFGGGDSFLANLPGGMTEAANTSFETALTFNTNYDGWTIVRDGGTTEGATLYSTTRVSSDGGEGSWMLRTRFAEGSLGGNAGGGTGVTRLTSTTEPLNTRAMYLAMRMRLSSGYRLHYNNEKLYFPNLTEGGGLGSIVELGPNRNLVALPNPSGAFTAITSDNIYNIGEWFTLEIYIRLNSPGTGDGIRRCWMNGTQVTNETDKVFYDGGTQALFNWVRLDDTRGGGDDTLGVPTGGQWREVDRLTLYTGS
jgi:hypothetical protein